MSKEDADCLANARAMFPPEASESPSDPAMCKASAVVYVNLMLTWPEAWRIRLADRLNPAAKERIEELEAALAAREREC